ncbi:hypothetical protein A7985_13825 [Pseudoalteromonas luteoviolacea]|uniref:DUF2306 domain-containing protein n=1 Tax=Pseudoalteromonas luteoviolacea TaxID=43657 RepID=A0A1C0TQ50_9GAMM|nr:DUF2306 domain-containing protein [Pseudoalteromonas luteoviolacea]MBQ4811829.1 DUF2306 domain-containing protein [Pseudoalteromonas luteoviolacea]OCQ20868.1 hypothetical protein A7985_13825 [Pseudoalteromonas luteoviolacea]
MISLTVNKLRSLSFNADNTLSGAIKTWVVVALAGQWFFAMYILSLYALPLMFGAIEKAQMVSPSQGLNSNIDLNSTMFFAHVLPAILMAMSGLLQLIPNVRTRFPKFHRYNGRMFFTLGLMGAFTGLYLTWITGHRLSDIGSIGVTVNGILIPVAIYFAWQAAVKKRFAQHQRFAVHSFLLVNGVWTFRLYLMGWYIVNQGMNGNTLTLDGPADIALSFASFLLPMAIYEVILWGKKQRRDSVKWGIAALACFGTLITFIGVIAAGMMMWLPKISNILKALF